MAYKSALNLLETEIAIKFIKDKFEVELAKALKSVDTEVQDKITQTVKFLQEDGEIDPDLTLRQVYDRYLPDGRVPSNAQKKNIAGNLSSFFNTFNCCICCDC